MADHNHNGHNHEHHHDHDHDHNEHSHGHDSNSSDTRTWTEKNKAHWDNMAATYNSLHTQKKFGDLINKMNAFVLKNIKWIGVPFLDPSSAFESQSTSLTSSSAPTTSARVLDYACGPGTLTSALAGYATEYVGIDLSDNMVAEYNKRFTSDADSSSPSTATVPAEKLNAHAVVGNLLDPKGTPQSLNGPTYFNFDLAVVSGGFHHFEDVELATERLAERLKPGGVLMIFDFLSHAPHDLHGEPALNTVVHHGFDEASVRKLFGGAGLEDVQIKLMEEKILLRGTAERQGFLARGRKPVV